MEEKTTNKFKDFTEGFGKVIDGTVDMMLTVLGACIFIIEGTLITPISSIVDSIHLKQSYWSVLKGRYCVYLHKVNDVIDRKIGEMEL